MRPNALTDKYVFMDTDIRLGLTRGGDAMVAAFGALWDFIPMVATLAEVRRHAPNDLAANAEAHEAARKACGAPRTPGPDDACVEKEFAVRARDLGERVARRAADMESRARVYRTEYLPRVPATSEPAFEVDRDALFAYVENVPYDRSQPVPDRRRTYGAPVGMELQAGKHIHHVWLGALADTCRAGDRTRPRQVILHNAYFYPPANLTDALSRMVNGELDCGHVTVTVLTNSIETTDLNIVNVTARHAVKAFTEFYRRHEHPRRARFAYYEYQVRPGEAKQSLHSKVAVLGDDVLVGSANADVRSYMMDSNNALLIRRAPAFTRAYVGHVQRMLADRTRTRSLDDYFASTPRETMLQEDLGTFRELLAKYHADGRLDAGQQADLEKRFTDMLDSAYHLTRDSIAAGSSASTRRERQNAFNALFKPI
jgi:cardiolipin synthase C